MFELRRLNREIKQNLRGYDAAVKKAKQEKKSEKDIEDLESNFSYEYFELADKIKVYITTQLTNKANRLLLEVPQYDEPSMWEQSNFVGKSYLTEAGIAKVRSTIREEEAARRKVILDWVSVGAVVTGMIGSATGLLAIILK